MEAFQVRVERPLQPQTELRAEIACQRRDTPAGAFEDEDFIEVVAEHAREFERFRRIFHGFDARTVSGDIDLSSN